MPCRGGEAPPGTRRVTFLVNLWLHHRPLGIERLPAPLAAALRAPWAAHPQRGAFFAAAAPPPQRQIHEPPRGLSPENAAKAPQLLSATFGRKAKVPALPNPCL